MSELLQRLTSDVRAAQDEQLAGRDRAPVSDRLARIRAEVERRNAPRRLSTGAKVAMLAAAAACVLAVWGLGSAPPLTVARAGQPLASDAWIKSQAASEAVTFSDGTQVTLSPESAVRILELHARGAALALERGTLHAEVVPARGARWMVAAGPFQVHVTGTVFDASYDPLTEELVVTMREGSVRVTGPCLEQARNLANTESARFRCEGPRDSEPARAAPEPSPAPTSAQRDETEAPKVAAASPTTRSSAPAVPAEPKADDWRALAREGHFKNALAAAEQRGFAELCQSESQSGLLELGNIARLAGNAARAAQAYQALRSRFAGSPAAASAAFQLGRLAFDGAGNLAAAKLWFNVYLSEQPGGSLGQEALGRVLEAEHRLGQKDAAARTASRYLQLFPSGAHAPLARSLTAE